MKNDKFNLLKDILLLGFVLLLSVSCEREVSDDATIATFPATGEIFTDTRVGMGSNFYFPYGPDGDNPVGRGNSCNWHHAYSLTLTESEVI